MPERGRRPQGRYKQKTEVFSTRIRADTKAALEGAARERGHSLSQEVEYRLRRSFDEDQGIIEKLGGRQNYAVLRLISSLMETIYNPADARASWLLDPHAFDQLVKAVILVLEELRPPGDPSVPPIDGPMGEALEAIAPLQANIEAGKLLFTVKEAPLDLPLNPDYAAPFIRADLGEAAERIGKQKGRRITRGTAEDFRRTAREMEHNTDEETS
jgi:hypothetical protein